VWANELEFMLRFFDHGFRHLHLPEVQAIHMKMPAPYLEYLGSRAYRINARHFAYVAGKLLRPRDAMEALIALATRVVRDAVREEPAAVKALPETILGFAEGLRRRQGVRNASVSRTFRRNFESFSSPWWLSRPLPELIAALPRERLRFGLEDESSRPPGRRDEYYRERARFFPTSADTLQF
jgi:hypothetical protein